jgi:carbonic anhydrase
MERLLDGIRHFQKEVFPHRKDLFESLAGGQNPEALFITCADSRVVPDLIMQSQPGDLFICRNAGNMVPSYGDAQGGVSATIEYAVAALNVEHVIVCGHTDCGAMKGILQPELLSEMPKVRDWLALGELARTMVKENYPNLTKEEQLRVLIQENAVAQLAHLHTYPCIASRVARGKIQLHAWVYNIKTGEVQAWDPQSHTYVPIEQYTPVRVTSRMRPIAV